MKSTAPSIPPSRVCSPAFCAASHVVGNDHRSRAASSGREVDSFQQCRESRVAAQRNELWSGGDVVPFIRVHRLFQIVEGAIPVSHGEVSEGEIRQRNVKG